MKIQDGSKVFIIGGGPAGALFALYLQQYGAENHIRPEITIFQQRDFSQGGPKGCKGCAGILSTAIHSNLSELGLVIPRDVIRNDLTGYTMHSPYTSIFIEKPEEEKEIASIYRGSGPREAHGEHVPGFDDWLLSQAVDRGITVIHKVVSGIELGSLPSITVDGERLEADLLVLAAGVSAKKVPVTGLDYAPPETRIASLDELYLGEEKVKESLGGRAHGFLIPHLGIVFGALVPKGPFVTVTVLSAGKTPVSVEDFLNYNIVRDVLPKEYERVCGCRPKAVIGMAKHYMADRFVAVGDAAVSKLYQDGITTALITARQAARTAIDHGITRRDFVTHYQPIVKEIDKDNRWGHLLFSMNNRMKDSRTFLLTQHRLTGTEQENTRGPQPFTKTAWGMLTGSYRYGDLVKSLIRPASVFKLATGFLMEKIRGLNRKDEESPRKLHVGGRKVLILGSGFGGTYALRNLVKSLNRNEHVETTMVSNENYFLFTPLLHEVAVGRVEMRHIAYPLRSLHWKDRFNFIQGVVQKIDLENKKVLTSAGELEYDYLVLGLGSTNNAVGVDPNGKNVFMLKTLTDGMNIRNHIVQTFEQANVEKDPARRQQLLTFVVTGAGYTGVQVVTALRDLVYGSLPRCYKGVDPAEIRIILVEAASKIVADLHPKVGAYVMDYLIKGGIEVKLKAKVTRAWNDGVQINDSENIPASTVIWASGFLVNPRISELKVAQDRQGRVMVNEFLELRDVPNVYAVGDCAHIKDPKTGRPIPPLAHTAVRHGRVVAKNILADIRGLNRKPYRYSKPPDMVNLGTYKAVFHYRFLRLYGFVPRLIMATGYLLLITGAANRIRIVTDWMLSLLFGRDTTLLKNDDR